MIGDESRRTASLKKRLEQWVKFTLLPPLGGLLIRAIKGTMRLDQRGYEPVDALYREGKAIILAFWHAQQLMVLFGYRGSGLQVLISQHGDGEIIARLIARFGHEAVRGSSTKGGARALRALIKLGRSGKDLAVTPDGPKGPRHVAKLGVIQLAKASGLPIVPLGFGCSKKNSSRAGIASWCRIPSRAGSFSGGSRSGCRARRMRPRSKPRVSNWSRL